MVHGQTRCMEKIINETSRTMARYEQVNEINLYFVSVNYDVSDN